MNRNHLTLIIRALMIFSIGISGPIANPQVTARGTISISARLPGSVRLSQQIIPLSFVVQQGTTAMVTVPLEITWNMDPNKTQSFRVIATLNGLVLQGADGRHGVISKSEIEARVADGEFRSFGNSGGKVVLLNRRIEKKSRIGSRQEIIEMCIGNDPAAGIHDGLYEGVLYLEAQAI